MKPGVVACALLMLFGCGPGAQKPTIPVGAVFSTTGVVANLGQEQADAAALAVEQINAAGGVLGHDLQLTLRDDGTDAEKGKAAAQVLADARVVGVVGPPTSGVALAVHNVLAPAGIPQIATSATSPLLTSEDSQGTLFRTCASDALQGKLIAQRAKAKNFSRMAIIHIPGAYGTGLADEFETAFKAGGGTVTHRVEYTEAQTSYAALVSAAMATDPDAVLLVAYPVDGAQIIKDYLANPPAGGAFWFFTDAVQDTAFVTAVGPSNFTFGHEGTGPGTPSGAAWEAYAAAFKAKYGRDASTGSFSANAYDAVYLIALALEAGKKADAETVKTHLAKASAGGKAYSPAEIKAALTAAQAGEDVNYEGASGNVDLDDKGDVVAPYNIWKVDNGSLVTVEERVSP